MSDVVITDLLKGKELSRVTECEICGAKIVTPMMKPERHICDDCVSKLRKLMDKE